MGQEEQERGDGLSHNPDTTIIASSSSRHPRSKHLSIFNSYCGWGRRGWKHTPRIVCGGKGGSHGAGGCPPHSHGGGWAPEMDRRKSDSEAPAVSADALSPASAGAFSWKGYAAKCREAGAER